MSNYGRGSMNSDERQEAEAIERSLKVSSYLNEVYESIHTGAAPKVNVPNLKEPTRAEIMGRAHSGESLLPSENESVVPMDWDGVYKTMDNNQVQQETSALPQSVDAPQAMHQASAPKFSISRNQWNAIKKYPSLVDFLGRENGEKIAASMHNQMNLALAEIVSKNSQEANEFALVCQAENQNLKQYFKGNNWICRVVASGPFRGDEAIYYSKDKNIAKILRRHASGDDVNYEDVSNGFNVIFEFGENDNMDPNVVDALDKVAQNNESKVQKGTTEDAETDGTTSDTEPISD